MEYCLRNRETTKTLQKVKGWSEPVPLYSGKENTIDMPRRANLSFIRDSKIHAKVENGKYCTYKYSLNYQQSKPISVGNLQYKY